MEAMETFEVTLLPTPEDLFKVMFVTGKDKAIVTISDGEFDRSKNVFFAVFFSEEFPFSFFLRGGGGGGG